MTVQYPSMNTVIFEGSLWDTFAPLSINRPAFSLVSGMTSLLEKHVRYLRPERLTLWVRPQLEQYCRERLLKSINVPTKINEPLDDEPALILSGRSLHFSRYEVPEQECVDVDGGSIIRQAFVKRPGLSPEDALHRTKNWLKLQDLPHTMPNARLAEYCWDLINWNEEALVNDSLAISESSAKLPAGAYHVVHEDNVWLGADVSLKPGVVLDASRGPITLARGVEVGANSVIEGPAYIGEFSRIAPLTSIRAGTSIGPQCKIGGAVSNSIILACSNKPYEGYLGDSYVGQWCNLGSGTTTANVKTTYGEISVSIGSRRINTGRRSMGAIIGDHAKTSIGTRLSPGCYVGYSCIVAGSGLAPTFVPSFSFWTGDNVHKMRVEKSVEISRRVMDRRDRMWTEVEEQVHQYAAQAAAIAEK